MSGYTEQQYLQLRKPVRDKSIPEAIKKIHVLKKDADEFNQEYMLFSGAVKSLMITCQNFH